jgi:hypothetical protein
MSLNGIVISSIISKIADANPAPITVYQTPCFQNISSAPVTKTKSSHSCYSHKLSACIPRIPQGEKVKGEIAHRTSHSFPNLLRSHIFSVDSFVSTHAMYLGQAVISRSISFDDLSVLSDQPLSRLSLGCELEL